MTQALLSVPLAPSPLNAGPGPEALDLNDLFVAGIPGRHVGYYVNGTSALPYVPPGSLVIVNTFKSPVNGDVIAAMLNGIAHVKIFEKKESHLRLVSPNAEFMPIEIRPEDDFEVLGVVEGCCILVSPEQKQESVYRVTSIDPADGLYKVRFQDEYGKVVSINLSREGILDGMSIATKAIGRKILNFRRMDECGSLLVGLFSALSYLAV